MGTGETSLAGLLVSVRNAKEARAALAGGANLIDVKEPSAGSLGAASPQTWQEIGKVVGERLPLSAALGELDQWDGSLPKKPFRYVKWGLSNLRGIALRQKLAPAIHDAKVAGMIPVAVAYADFDQANCPRPLEVLELASGMGVAVLLMDTFTKDGKSLLDYYDLESLAMLRYRSAGMGIALALAGSLNLSHFETILPIRPDWIAVRGAVCLGQRTGEIQQDLVAELVKHLNPPGPTTED